MFFPHLTLGKFLNRGCGGGRRWPLWCRHHLRCAAMVAGFGRRSEVWRRWWGWNSTTPRVGLVGVTVLEVAVAATGGASRRRRHQEVWAVGARCCNEWERWKSGEVEKGFHRLEWSWPSHTWRQFFSSQVLQLSRDSKRCCLHKSDHSLNKRTNLFPYQYFILFLAIFIYRLQATLPLLTDSFTSWTIQLAN